MSKGSKLRHLGGMLATLLLALRGGPGAFAEDTPRSVLFRGEITANDVYVRSGDSMNHYTICKLKAGDRVEVVAERGEWMEILPPEGTFSLISGDFVDTVDNKSGVVNGDNVRVRAGSLLNSNKYTVQTMLQRGTEVAILGSNPDGFLRITPPAGATLWISRAYVERVSSADDPAAASASPSKRTPGPDSHDADSTVADSEGKTADPLVAATGGTDDADVLARRQPDTHADGTGGARPSLASSVIPASSALAGIPATDRTRQLQSLERALEVELGKPLQDRQFDDLLAGYRALSDQNDDDVARRYALSRVSQINDMQDIRGTALNLRKLDEDAERQRQEFFAARARIPIAPPPPPPGFDVQGLLRDSALYPAGSLPRRYRVVDAAAGGRTIAYIEIPLTAEMNLDDYLGRFVGIRASSKRPQEGAIDPVPIYVVSEVVELTSGDSPEGSVSQP